MNVEEILERLYNKEISVEDASKALSSSSFADLGFAKVDLERKNRCGHAEVIFSQNKSCDHLKKIIQTLIDNKQKNIIATRLNSEQFKMIEEEFKNVHFNYDAKLCVFNKERTIKYKNKVAIVSAGTSDFYVCEEIRETLSAMGIESWAFYDCGVAGIKRLFASLESIRTFSVIIVVAGMEGALSSVIGGLVDCPVIAVPTSVGYGA
ncbi:MAG: nickel pincer cofactor biosynthesis protein LarB, partial [Firmicutes bacterium]|nr:nickel pincer cofactor biosynthesis protein LarB [Bacillota bacterium]